MEYVTIRRFSRDEVETAISDDNPVQLGQAVLSAALHSEDPIWAEGICLRLAKHELSGIRANAVQGFGHLARIHRNLNQKRVKAVIEAAFFDESEGVRGAAVGAADDVEHFLKWKIDRPAGYE